MKLEGKVGIITGASRGIGAATAILFAKEGASVVIDYFVSDYEPDAKENALKIKSEIEAFGGTALIFHCDVRDESQIQAMISETLKEYGKIDFLVNNAAVVIDATVNDRTSDNWNQTVDTCLLGTYLCLKFVSPHMSDGGSIINASSTNAINYPNPESMDYDAAKAGIFTLTKNFAKHLATRKIRVNSTAVGWANTAMNDQLDENFIKEEAEKIYLQRFAEPEEVAKVNLFLVSEDSGYINAATIVIDGGHD